jgi:hypothetical protein
VIIVTERGLAFTAEQFAEQWADVLGAPTARDLVIEDIDRDLQRMSLLELAQTREFTTTTLERRTS